MIERARGFMNTGSLDLGQSSSCPGPPQYLVQKNLFQYDTHYQGHYQQQVSCNNHTQHQCQPYPQCYHQYNQVPPQQPRLPPPQQAPVSQQPQQPLLMPQQQQPQQHHHQQLPSQPLPQQLPLQSLPQQAPSTLPSWTRSPNQQQQPQHHHLQQQQNHHHHHHNTLHQNNHQLHHHQQQQQQQQQHSTPQNTSAPTTATSQAHHTQHPHHQPSTSHTSIRETQTETAPSPTAPHQHLHPTVQDMAALQEEKARLEAQLMELRNSRRCVVCLDKDQSAIFMPCAHLVTCPPCAVTLNACPVCRAPVQYLVPVILD